MTVSEKRKMEKKRQMKFRHGCVIIGRILIIIGALFLILSGALQDATITPVEEMIPDNIVVIRMAIGSVLIAIGLIPVLVYKK